MLECQRGIGQESLRGTEGDRRMGGGVEGCGGASIAIHLIWPSIIDTSGTVHDHRRIYRLHLHYCHLNFSLLFFSSSTLRMQNSNVCGGKRGGVTSWKRSNPHFSYRANAGSSAQHSWRSVFSTGKPLVLFTANLSLQQRRTRRGRWSLPWFAMFLHWRFFFLFHAKKTLWCVDWSITTNPVPLAFRVTTAQILIDEVMLYFTTSHSVAFGNFCNFATHSRRCYLDRRTM